jgi:hypothetical protein
LSEVESPNRSVGLVTEVSVWFEILSRSPFCARFGEDYHGLSEEEGCGEHLALRVADDSGVGLAARAFGQYEFRHGVAEGGAGEV